MTALGDIIRFRDDKLFYGAVDVSWFFRDRAKSRAAATAFVFHGPRYHGVRQYENSEHKATDTASFALGVLQQCCGKGEQPFKMAVSGYGTGKSHLALALAELLHEPEGEPGNAVCAGIADADAAMGRECRILLNEQHKPSLVIPLNGMNEFPLMSEITRRALELLRADGHDGAPIERVRPRFIDVATLIEKLDIKIKHEICQEAGKPNLETLITALRKDQDETVYKAVAEYLINLGLPIDVGQNGSLQDLFISITENYCGEGKPYKNVVILFDEFGKYLEFATGKPYIAGSGALQELYEAVQVCSQYVCFVGFIQFELKSYLQRINAQYRNEAQRYITRYDNTEKYYLSTNFETLIAHLIERKDSEFIENQFMKNGEKNIETAYLYIRQFFPETQHSAIWKDQELFGRVVCRGGWPLSPFALWFISFLASGSRFLQGRSALSLLRELFGNLAAQPVNEMPRGGIAAVELLTDSLREELIASEESGNQGAITHTLTSILNRHCGRLGHEAVNILKAIVIAEKLRMAAKSREDAVRGLSWLSGISSDIVQKELQNLQYNLNLVEWDDTLCYFDLLGDAIPKTQFISFLHQRRRNEYNSMTYEKLFTSTVDHLTDLTNKDVETSFGEEHNIRTREWRFASKKTNMDVISHMFHMTISEYSAHIGPDEAKGCIIYCYVRSDIYIEDAMNKVRKDFRGELSQQGLRHAPIFIILLHDADEKLGNLLADYDILQKLNQTEKSKFANLVPSYEESLCRNAENVVHQLIKERHWITSLHEELPQRLGSVGLAIFEHIYTNVVPFPMDGFNTANGNGPKTAYDFARKLFHGKLTFDDVQAMNSSEKNRAVTLLKNNWQIFSPSGSVKRFPEPLRPIFSRWDKVSQSEGLVLGDKYEEIMRPPYGMNSLAALLAMGVYLAARLDKHHINDNGRAISIQEWASSLFSDNWKKFASHSFGNARLIPSGESSNQWSELFDEWESCLSYQQLREFPEKAEALRKVSPITTAEDMERYIALKTRSEEAQKEWNKFMELCAKAENQQDVAEQKGDFSLYLASTANFNKLFNIVNSKPGCWPAEYSARYGDILGKMRQQVIAAFPDWLDTLAPRAATLDGIAEFKKKMAGYQEKLSGLSLDAQVRQMEKATKEACHNIEVIGKYKNRMMEVNNWITENKNTLSTSTFVALQSSLKTAKEYAKSLSVIARNKPLEGLSELRENLSNYQKNIEIHIAKLQERLAKIFTITPSSREDTEKLLQCLNMIEPFFERSNNAEDIINLKNTIELILRRWQTIINDTNLDNNMIEIELKNFKSEIEQHIENNELQLNINDIYMMINNDVLRYRKELSLRWLVNAREKCKNLSNMTVYDANMLLSSLRSAPAYLIEKDKVDLDSLRKNVREYLEQQKIEWLVQEYNSLSKVQQQIFLQRLIEASNG